MRRLLFIPLLAVAAMAAELADPNVVPRVPGTDTGVIGGIPAAATRGTPGGGSTIDVTASPYFASPYGDTTTTGTITSGTNSLVVASASTFEVGNVVRVGYQNIDEFDVTAGASTDGTLILYLRRQNTVGYIGVAVTSGDTAAQVATKIRAAASNDLIFSGTGTTVRVTNLDAQAQGGTPSLSANSTGVTFSSVATIQAGSMAVTAAITNVSGNTLTLASNASSSVTDGLVVHSDRAAIQSAINAATSGDVAFFPAGKYRIYDNYLDVAVGDSGYSLRGEGSGQLTGEARSILDCRTTTCIYVGGTAGYGWAQQAYVTPTTNNTITSGLTKGSTTLTVADATQFTVNRLAQIALQNQESEAALEDDNAILTHSVAGYQTLRRQMIRIVAKSGDGPGGSADTLTITPAVHFTPDSGLVAKVNELPDGPTSGIGIEDLEIEMSYNGGQTGLVFHNAVNSWAKNVKVYRPANYGIQFVDSLFCEARRCRVGERTDGSNGAGFLVNHVGNSLIEDNVVLDIGPGFEVNFGSAGNVIAFNFVDHKSSGGGININHGPHNSFNLYEGNIAPDIKSDGYFGSSSNDTIFRNWITGNLYRASPAANTYVVALARFARNYAVIGNILGSDGYPFANSPSWPYGTVPLSLGGSPFGAATVGTAQPSVGDDWIGRGVTATLTTRSSDTAGTISLNKLGDVQGVGYRLYISWSDTLSSTFLIGGISGTDITFTGASTAGTALVLPATSTAGSVYFGAVDGYLEEDRDVFRTNDATYPGFTLAKGNYWATTGHEHIPDGSEAGETDESLGSDTLPTSLFRSAKPDWFGDRAWPVFDPASPGTITQTGWERLPAGYRYVNNAEPGAGGGGSANATINQLNVGTLSLP